LASQRQRPLSAPPVEPTIWSTKAKAALCAWVGIIAAGIALGLALRAFGRDVQLLPPILASFAPGPRPGLVLPIGVATLYVFGLPAFLDRLGWRSLLAVEGVATLAWTLSLALAEGTSGVTRGLRWRSEYPADVPAVRAGPAAFLRTFTDDIGRYSVHVRGHPPGFVLLLTGLDHLGLRGTGWAAALVIVAGATAPVAVLLAIREVAGSATARRAAPWLIVAPTAIWVATSADALYMALGAWSVALVIIATGRGGLRSHLPATVGGVIGGLVLLGSYGLALLAVIPLAVLVSRRRPGWRWALPAVFAGIGVAAVLAALLPFGFSWLDGLRATRHEYYSQVLDRPYWALLLINLSAWALALGPASIVGLAHLRERRLWLLVGGGITAALLANLSGLSQGEVERIWLPFTIWVLPAGAAFTLAGRSTRIGLAWQSGSAIALVSILTTHW
jgi:methylthioxylose transferase